MSASPRPANREGASKGPQIASSAFSLTAERFQYGADIPSEFTCDGPNASPGLIWTEPPASTTSFALILEERDIAPDTSVRWIPYEIPATARQLREAKPKRDELMNDTRQGINDWRGLGYSATPWIRSWS